MTRINVVPPATLTDAHLLAEYRELPRCFGLVPRPGDPETYRLGRGHVRFFADKPNWLRRRQAQIVHELLDRGYTLGYTDVEPATGPDEWTPDTAATAVNLARLRERLRARPDFYTHRRRPVDGNFYGA